METVVRIPHPPHRNRDAHADVPGESTPKSLACRRGGDSVGMVMHHLLSALVLGLTACGGTPQATTESCQDAQCRQEAVVAAFGASPSQGVAAVAALPDDVEKSAAVARLMELHPSQISELCPALPEGKLRVRCQRTADRPHLWEARTKPIETGQRVSGGPRSHRLAPEKARRSAVADVPGDLGICATAPDPHTCAWARAMELGAQGKARDAAAKCAAIEIREGSVQTWQAECRFSAAEAMIQGQGSQGYAGAAELCMSADRFQERCLIHLSRDLASRTPAADSKPAQALVGVVASADAIGRFWADDGAADKFVEHFWSVAMGYAFLRAESVSGDILDGVPARVRPHVHAAAAWRLMQLDATPQSLQDWTGRLAAALERRVGRPPGDDKAVHMPGLGNLWHAGTAEDTDVRAVIYMGMGRRATSTEALVDQQIALLEAAARQSPPLRGVLDEGAEHPVAAVRWTAQRLIGVGGLPAAVKQGPSR